jgi:uncharacterized protein involved in response to NO
MQLPPLAFDDILLLIAIGAIITLITLELSSPTYGHTNLTLRRQRLKKVSYVLILLFIVTLPIKIIQVLA